MEKQGTFKAMTFVLLIAVVILAIFLFTSNKTTQDEVISEGMPIIGEEVVDETMVEEVVGEIDTDELEYQGEILAGASSPFIDFNQSEYVEALESGKTVFLYFYAKWCPTCKRELRNATQPAFDAYEGDNLIGFRVNYNDRDTDDFEDDLAEEFGVLYQHTKVFINGEDIQVYPNTWDESDYLEAFNSL